MPIWVRPLPWRRAPRYRSVPRSANRAAPWKTHRQHACTRRSRAVRSDRARAGGFTTRAGVFESPASSNSSTPRGAGALLRFTASRSSCVARLNTNSSVARTLRRESFGPPSLCGPRVRLHVAPRRQLPEGGWRPHTPPAEPRSRATAPRDGGAKQPARPRA